VIELVTFPSYPEIRILGIDAAATRLAGVLVALAPFPSAHTEVGVLSLAYTIVAVVPDTDVVALALFACIAVTPEATWHVVVVV
jgi:hypothetical protein